MSECHPVSDNNPFRINNIVPGENYTVSLSLRNVVGGSQLSDSITIGEGSKSIAFAVSV